MTNPSPSIPDAIRALSASLLQLGRTRLELFGIEFAEQKENAVRAGVLAAVGLLCLAMAAAVFSAFVIVVFWDSPYRLLAVGLLGLAWLLAGLLCLWLVMRNLRRAQRPFALTLAELERDLQALASRADAGDAPGAITTRRTGQTDGPGSSGGMS